MNKHYSILHISDLHKGENNDFDHLFASLCNDADSYDQDIPKPEFIVVCGDLAAVSYTHLTLPTTREV